MKDKLLGIAITVLVLTMFFISPFLLNIKPAKAGTSTSATLYSNGDTYVNSLSPATNYGTSNNLYVSSISGTAELKYTFITFNMSELVNSTTVISSISSATLSLYCTSEDNGDVSCYPSNYLGITSTYVPTFSGENTTTYNWGISGFAVTNLQSITTTGWKTWDVTILVNFYGQTDFAFAQDHFDHTTVFSSRHTANKPYLNITYTYASVTPSNFGKYIKCYFNNSGGDILTNFVVPISIPTTQLSFWDYAGLYWSDIYFFDEDNATKLYYEVEYPNGWSLVDKRMQMWVKVPQINASNTDFIYLYYNYTELAMPPIEQAYNFVLNHTAYWDSNYGDQHSNVWSAANTAWHLGEAATFIDSAGANLGYATGTLLRNQTGVYDGSVFTNTTLGGYIKTGQAGDFERTDAFSGSCWATPWIYVAGELVPFAKRDGAAIYRGWSVKILSSGQVQIVLCNTINTNDILVTGNDTVLNNATWQYIAFTYDGTSKAAGIQIYVNGIKQTKTVIRDLLSATIDTTAQFQISGRFGDASDIFQGGLDEVRMYPANLTENWIKAEYKCGIGTFVSYVYSKIWYDVESFTGRLYNYSWWGVETWNGILASKFFNNAELWNGLLTPKLFYNVETWTGLLHTLGFFNVETWSGFLHTLGWYEAEHWETNYTDIQEQDVLISSVDNTYLNFTRVGVSPYINTYGTGVDYIVGGVGVGNYISGNYSIQDWELLQPTIKFTEILNITMIAHTYYSYPVLGGKCSYGIFPNGSYLTQTSIGWFTGNSTIGDIKPYINGINEFRNLKLTVNETNIMGQIRCDMVTFKVYYYPKYLAIGNWAEFSFVEKWIIIFGENILITFVRWGMLGMGVGFLLLAMILLYVGFKLKNGVVLVAALIVFLLGIVMAIAGAGI